MQELRVRFARGAVPRASLCLCVAHMCWMSILRCGMSSSLCQVFQRLLLPVAGGMGFGAMLPSAGSEGAPPLSCISPPSSLCDKKLLRLRSVPALGFLFCCLTPRRPELAPPKIPLLGLPPRAMDVRVAQLGALLRAPTLRTTCKTSAPARLSGGDVHAPLIFSFAFLGGGKKREQFFFLTLSRCNQAG